MSASLMPSRPARRPVGRSVQHYAALKQQQARLADAAARARTAEPLDSKLIVRIPKPMLRDLTAARRELAARQGRRLAPSPVLRPRGAAPSYRPRHYVMAPAPM